MSGIFQSFREVVTIAAQAVVDKIVQYKTETLAAVQVLSGRVDSLVVLADATAAKFVDLLAAGGAGMVGYLRDGAGAVRRTLRDVLLERVSAKDFGAKGDGVTDDTAALQAWMSFLVSQQRKGYLPAGIYMVAARIDKVQSFYCPSIDGDGHRASVLRGSRLGAGAMVKIKGGSGSMAGAVLRGVGFEPGAAADCVEVADQCGLKFKACRFGASTRGLLLHNESPGGFTEYVVADGCEFDGACAKPLEYKRTGGNDSFHGSGIRGGSINTPATASGECVKVGAGCYPYNAPFSPQVWVNGANRALVRNEGADYVVFLDGPTIEAPAPGMAVGDETAQQFVIVGRVAGVSRFRLGAARLAKSAMKMGPEDGNVFRVDYLPMLFEVPLVTGDNVVQGPGGRGDLVLAKVVVAGANYEDRAVLAIDANGYGAAGICGVLMQGFRNNMAGYGFPSYSVDAAGRLVIGMPTVPAGAVRATVVWSCTSPMP